MLVPGRACSVVQAPSFSLLSSTSVVSFPTDCSAGLRTGRSNFREGRSWECRLLSSCSRKAPSLEACTHNERTDNRAGCTRSRSRAMVSLAETEYKWMIPQIKAMISGKLGIHWQGAHCYDSCIACTCTIFALFLAASPDCPECFYAGPVSEPIQGLLFLVKLVIKS